jgi:hypothetical protein
MLALQEHECESIFHLLNPMGPLSCVFPRVAKINAYITVTADLAVKSAQEAESEIQRNCVRRFP